MLTNWWEQFSATNEFGTSLLGIFNVFTPLDYSTRSDKGSMSGRRVRPWPQFELLNLLG